MAKNISVLMVDDEEQFRATTSKILTRRGYDTTMAASGEEALEVISKKSFDVVILDIKMPGMDGHGALEKIKQANPDTQVIMLTGHGDIDSAQKSLSLGAYDYLNKPCDIDLLASKINDAYKVKHKDDVREEKKAKDIMIHIDDYTIISEDNTIQEAMQKLQESFEGLAYSSRIMETGHRSFMVFDRQNNFIGILSILDLIQGIRPAYLSSPKPSTADSIQYSSMFWSGLFTTQTKALSRKKVGDIMANGYTSVDENTNLMEIADLMTTQQIRRVVITSNDRPVGIVREQELFFEMTNIIL